MAFASLVEQTNKDVPDSFDPENSIMLTIGPTNDRKHGRLESLKPREQLLGILLLILVVLLAILLQSI